MPRLRRPTALAGLPALPGCVVAAPNIEGGTRLTAFGRADEPGQPPGRASDETTPEQLQLAREQGAAVGAAFRYLVDRVPGAGEYVVGYPVSAPVGYYQGAGGRSVWVVPEGTAHLAVAVRDGPVADPDPLGEQRHVVYPTLNVQPVQGLTLNLGVGLGLTGGSDDVTLKGILSYEFGTVRPSNQR